jgi:hypothetical protein
MPPILQYESKRQLADHDTGVKQVGLRTRDVPEYQVEIIRRFEEALPGQISGIVDHACIEGFELRHNIPVVHFIKECLYHVRRIDAAC